MPGRGLGRRGAPGDGGRERGQQQRPVPARAEPGGGRLALRRVGAGQVSCREGGPPAAPGAGGGDPPLKRRATWSGLFSATPREVTAPACFGGGGGAAAVGRRPAANGRLGHAPPAPGQRPRPGTRRPRPSALARTPRTFPGRPPPLPAGRRAVPSLGQECSLVARRVNG